MSRSKRRRGNEVSITSIGLMADENEESHHTDEYECPLFLMARRGAAITLEVGFSRPLSGDSITVELHRGHRTSYHRGTRFTAQLDESPRYPHQLQLKALKSESSTVTLSLLLPADFPVGSYRMVIEVIPQDSKQGLSQEAERKIVVLFNPWCKGDQVYLPGDSETDEYIMNESGIIWAGAHNDMFTWPWNFAQFEEVSVQAALYLLDMHGTADSDARRDPVKVSRAITEMVNVEDSDGGVLFGLWSPEEKDYADGTDPTAWSGSSAILEEFWETKRAVRYGQCWVFGGLLTTVLRTLGIPARPVTNFESAHDGDGNRALDRYWDLQDELVLEKSHDSIWNYHVWVEAWMARPDLGPGYSGWQAMDATPQEISPHSKSYVVGPASLVAVKTGQSLPFDTNFVIAEVNADILDYCEVEKDKFELAIADTKRVGKAISTKSMGSSKRSDVTHSYKFEEGSVLERTALGVDKVDRASDVAFDVEFNRQAEIGEDFDVIVTVKSTASEPRHVNVRAIISTMTYTGGTGDHIKKGKNKIDLNQDGSGTFILCVAASDYLDGLRDQALLSVTVLAMVEETRQSLVSIVPYRLHRPDLTLIVDGAKVSDDQSLELSAGGTYSVKAFFTNPLKKTLTNVVFHIEGTRLTKPLKMPGQDTGSGKVAEVSFTLSPSPPRRQTQQECKLIVTCQSKELKGIMGTATITITK